MNASLFPLESWSAGLCKVAAEPLEFCPQMPAIARRFEAWWQNELLDRPLFVAYANCDAARPISRRLELLGNPEQWFEEKLRDMKQLRGVGDALPSIRVDFGPVMMGGLLGAPVEFLSDSTWTHTLINDDWTNAPDFELHDDNPWWRLLPQLVDMVASDAAGRYLLRTPSLGGAMDVLLNMRGAEALCMDVIEQPEMVTAAVEKIHGSWQRAFQLLFDGTLKHGAGLIHWIGLWSNWPHVVAECDFNYMIGPREFHAVALPEIRQVCAEVGRSVFHLDGPGAARHIDALLDTKELTTIQWVPGAGNNALDFEPMLHKIQQRGRPLQVVCRADEALRVAEALKPEGLCLLIDGGTAELMDEAFAGLCRRFGCDVEG